jgi:carbon monoxide dehydrogenase subunit G
MGQFSCSVTINRPVEEVFAVLTDPTRSPEWSKHSVRGELLTEGPPRVGSRRRTGVKGFVGLGTMESVFEVTESNPLRAVALRQVSASWGGSGATRYTFTPVDGATRVDWTWELNTTGPMKLFERPMLAVTRRAFQSDLENLKQLMESGRITADKPTADRMP